MTAARAALLLLLAACGRDLSLPSQAAPPVVMAFEPAAAFAGETVTLQGSGFDPVPARNVVHFGGAQAQADAFDPAAGLLTVRVPEDAGSGALAVATVAGLGKVSEASFGYRGIGHLRSGRGSTTVPILHRPPGIAAAGGDVYLASRLFRFVQSRQGRLLKVDHAPNAVATAPDASAIYVSVDDTVNHLVYRIDVATGKIGAPIALPFFPRALAAAADATGPVLLVAGDDAVSTGYLATFRGTAALAPLLSPLALPISAALATALTPSAGKAVVVAQRQATQGGAAVVQTGVLIVDLARPTAAATWVAAPGKGVPTGALAALGPAEVAVGFDDGTIGDLALALPPTWTAGSFDSLSRSPVGGLVTFNNGQSLLASKPAEGSVVAFDVGSKALLWGIPVKGRPIQLAADASGALYAADDSSNFVDAIDGNRGVWLNRVSFEPGLGSPAGAPCGVAFDAAPLDGSKPRFLVLARNAYSLIRVDAGSLQVSKPLNLVRGSASLALCVGVAPDGNVWVLHQSEIGRIDPATKKEVLLASGLPVPPTGLDFTADSKPIVRFPGEVAVVDAAGNNLGGVVFDGAVDSLSRRGDQIVATWTNGGQKPVVPHAALWSVAGFIAGSPPLARWDDATADLGFSGSISLAARTFLFYDTSPQLATAATIPLDDALAPLAEAVAPVRAQGPVLPTPDGRYFLWTRLRAPDLVLHMTRVVDGQPILNVADLPLPGPLSGAAFDSRGERLLVPVDAASAVQVFE